eukprot:364833-Chlamydomonas_euryale.AAC.14
MARMNALVTCCLALVGRLALASGRSAAALPANASLYASCTRSDAPPHRHRHWEQRGDGLFRSRWQGFFLIHTNGGGSSGPRFRPVEWRRAVFGVDNCSTLRFRSLEWAPKCLGISHRLEVAVCKVGGAFGLRHASTDAARVDAPCTRYAGTLPFRGVHHVALLCEKLETSLEFYEGVLGERVRILGGGNMNAPAGTTECDWEEGGDSFAVFGCNIATCSENAFYNTCRPGEKSGPPKR